MTKIELELCPCGARAHYDIGSGSVIHHTREHWLEGPSKPTREAALEAWNAMIRKWREKGKKEAS